MQQTGIPGEFDESSRAVPYMPRAKQGIGRRPKKRRVSPASAIEVEQIEEGEVKTEEAKIEAKLEQPKVEELTSQEAQIEEAARLAARACGEAEPWHCCAGAGRAP